MVELLPSFSLAQCSSHMRKRCHIQPFIFLNDSLFRVKDRLNVQVTNGNAFPRPTMWVYSCKLKAVLVSDFVGWCILQRSSSESSASSLTSHYVTEGYMVSVQKTAKTQPRMLSSSFGKSLEWRALISPSSGATFLSMLNEPQRWKRVAV